VSHSADRFCIFSGEKFAMMFALDSFSTFSLHTDGHAEQVRAEQTTPAQWHAAQ